LFQNIQNKYVLAFFTTAGRTLPIYGAAFHHRYRFTVLSMAIVQLYYICTAILHLYMLNFCHVIFLTLTSSTTLM